MGLEAGPTPQEVDERFHLLASETHPDHGGSADRFSEVVAARDRLKAREGARQLVRVGTSAVVASDGGELLELERERDIARKRQEASERVTKGLVRAEVSRLTRSRRRANFLAWLSGGAGAVTLALRATNSTGEGYIEYPWAAPALIVSILLGVICASASFAIAGRISRIEQAIEDASETLTSRATYLDLLYEILESTQAGQKDRWTLAELIRDIHLWSARNSERHTWRLGSTGSASGLQRTVTLPFIAVRRVIHWSVSGRFDRQPSLADLADVIGAQGFARLVIAKGEENSLLVAEEEIVGGRLLVRHRLALELASSSDPAAQD